MSFCSARPAVLFLLAIAFFSSTLYGQAQLPSSSAQKQGGKPGAGQTLDPGSVSNGTYTNKALAFTCKIPEGWVLRTDELNSGETKDEHFASAAQTDNNSQSSTAKTESPAPASSAGSRVLLAAFSRPPEAHGEEVNASIVIAAEPASNYPGLKEPVQYFGPITEVAQAQGLTMDEDPYQIAVGARTLVRGDFHKNIGTRVMRQSTLVLLSHGYAVSFTVISGTEDEVEDIIDGFDFQGSAKAGPPQK